MSEKERSARVQCGWYSSIKALTKRKRARGQRLAALCKRTRIGGIEVRLSGNDLRPPAWAATLGLNPILNVCDLRYSFD